MWEVISQVYHSFAATAGYSSSAAAKASMVGDSIADSQSESDNIKFMECKNEPLKQKLT